MPNIGQDQQIEGMLAVGIGGRATTVICDTDRIIAKLCDQVCCALVDRRGRKPTGKHCDDCVKRVTDHVDKV